MDNQLEYFKNNPPRCLDLFKVKPIEIEGIEFDGHGEEINPIFRIECKCGNYEHEVYGFNWENPDNGNIFFIGPIKLKCTKCNIENELFDIDKHGYDSELGHGCYSATGEGQLSQFKCEKCKATSFSLMARFEYTSDLFDEDFPEARRREKDLFTWFSLHSNCNACCELIEVSEYECA